MTEAQPPRRILGLDHRQLADRDLGQAGKDYRGLTIVVVVSEYMQQSCSQSVGNASKSL